MPIRRPRKIVSDLSANVIEEMRLRALRDECDKIMLAGGNFEKIATYACDVMVGDQFRNQPDTRTVIKTSNMRSNYPMITFDDYNVVPFNKTDKLIVFRRTAPEEDHSIYVDHSQGYPQPDPVNGFKHVARIHTIEVNDIVCHEEEYHIALRVFNIVTLADGRIHLMCTPLDVQSHGYGPIHIYGPTGMYVRKRKV